MSAWLVAGLYNAERVGISYNVGMFELPNYRVMASGICVELRIVGASQFPRVVVINLIERADRWARISSQFQNLGISVERFDAIRHEIGWIGCGLSHQACIRGSLDQPWVLVLEDDCELTKECEKKLPDLLSVLEREIQGWELFKGGPTMPRRDPVRPFSLAERLFYVHGYALHFALYNRWAYGSVLAWEPWRDRQIDVYLDELGRLEQPHFRSIAYAEHLGVQYSSPSDIEKAAVDYGHWFSESARILSKAEHNYRKVGSKFRYLRAQHKNWVGCLVMSCENRFLFHEQGGFAGTYKLEGLTLIVDWFDFGREEFVNISELWIFKKLILSRSLTLPPEMPLLSS